MWPTASLGCLPCPYPCVMLLRRWGYVNISDLEGVVSNYSKAGLPLEGLWVDIEAMNNRFQVFTFDKGEEC